MTAPHLMRGEGLDVEGLIRRCTQCWVPVSVPIDVAIEGYRREPNGLTLRAVILAAVPDRRSAQAQFDCLAGARDCDWMHTSNGTYTSAEMREGSLDGVRRTIACFSDA